MPKIVRDLAILIAFCGAFFLLVIFVRGTSTKASTASNFSNDRIQGDRMMSEGNWEKAIVHFVRLIEKDKYNAFAFKNLGDAEISDLYEQASEYFEKSRNKVYSDEEADSGRDRLLQHAARCIEIQKRLLKFDRYRGEALRDLAAISCFIGQRDQAMDYLYEYIDVGKFTGLPMWGDPKLGSLRERQDFCELTYREGHRLPSSDRRVSRRRNDYYSRERLMRQWFSSETLSKFSKWKNWLITAIKWLIPPKLFRLLQTMN